MVGVDECPGLNVLEPCKSFGKHIVLLCMFVIVEQTDDVVMMNIIEILLHFIKY